MKIHLIYSSIIMFLLIIVVGLTANKLFGRSVTIRVDDSEEYTLKMLPGGNLIFEKNGFLPLASYQDYWGNMDVRSVDKIGNHQINIEMIDGTQLIIKIGKIEIKSPNEEI